MGLRADVVVDQIQALDAAQQRDLLRQALHLVVPQFQNTQGAQVLQKLRLHGFDLVVAQMQLLPGGKTGDGRATVRARSRLDYDQDRAEPLTLRLRQAGSWGRARRRLCRR